MKNKSKIFGIYLPIFILALLVGVALRTVACINDFDPVSGYFDSNSLILPANITVAAVSIFFLTYLLKKKKEIKFIPNFTSISTYIPTGLIGVAEIFMAVHFILLAKNEYSKNVALEISPLTASVIIYFLIAVFAVLSVVHFIMTALIEKHSSTRRALFGLGTVIFLALYSVHLYFDSSTAVNAPNKLIDELSYLFAALFFLYETRLSMGREKWRAYIATGFISSLLCAYSSIPALVTYFVNGTKISNNIYESVLTFALFVFITARILLTTKLTEDKMNPTVDALSSFASEREKTVRENELKFAPPEPGEAVTQAEDENIDNSMQISIDEIAGDVSADASATLDDSADTLDNAEAEEESALEDAGEEISEETEEKITKEAEEAAPEDDASAEGGIDTEEDTEG